MLTMWSGCTKAIAPALIEWTRPLPNETKPTRTYVVNIQHPHIKRTANHCGYLRGAIHKPHTC